MSFPPSSLGCCAPVVLWPHGSGSVAPGFCGAEILWECEFGVPQLWGPVVMGSRGDGVLQRQGSEIWWPHESVAVCFVAPVIPQSHNFMIP